MDAVVTTEYGASHVEDVPVPEPDEDEVLLEVNRVQLSVTECWIWQGDLEPSDELDEKIRTGDGRVFGHEFSATVVEAGANVTDFDVGDRVYAPGKMTCGSCAYCERGYQLLCENSLTIGFKGTTGALAEYFTVPTEPLRALPDDVSNAEGAAMQPLADSLQTVYDADVTAGDVIVVIGAGVMGQQCGQVASHLGADRVYAVDIAEEKLDVAEDAGLIPIHGLKSDPVAEIRDRTGEIGADIVFTAVGGEQTSMTDGSDPRAQAFRMVRNGGTIVPRGILTNDEIGFDSKAMRLKAVDIVYPRSPSGVSSTGPNGDLGTLAPQLVASGRVSIEPFVDYELTGLDSFEHAVEITTNKGEYGALGPAQIVVSE